MAVEMLNIEALNALADNAPVTMLNLLRLRERSVDDGESGWETYQRYSEISVPMIKARGGTILWAGRIEAIALGIPGDEEWDFATLVHYPSRRAFLDMMTSEAYGSVANPLRERAVTKHVILAACPLYSKFGDA